MKTAVEFAVEKLEKFIPSGNQLVIHIILEEAKEMEKQQIIDAYENGYSDSDNTFELNKEYYTEILKKNKI